MSHLGAETPGQVDFDHPPDDPVAWFNQWLAEAEQTSLPNPNAMTLSTVGEGGRPSARTVLLKSIDSDGAVFYTNRTSRKGRQLTANPYAALLFHWDPLDRQVEIEGEVTAVSDAMSDVYFASRRRTRQIGAWASSQSEPIENRDALDAKAVEVEHQFADIDIPRPPHWGGYRVSLQRVEFWQGNVNRLHDRIVYTPNGQGGWKVQRLYP